MSTPNIQITEIGQDKIVEFIKVPFLIYKNDPCWVPPLTIERRDFLNPKKNPFFRHADVKFFIAYKDGKPVGRIASIINHNHNEFHNEKTGFFGFFESIDDYIVAYGLLQKAREHVKDAGMNLLRGPASFSTNDEVGLLTEGFYTPPVVMMTHNPQYYAGLFEKFGLKKAKDLYAYYFDGKLVPWDRVNRLSEQVKRRSGAYIRPVNFKKFDEEVALIKNIYNSAWEKNWGFVPLDDLEFDYMAKQLKQIADPDLVLLAYIDDEPAGFSLALPNINEILIKMNGSLLPSGIFKLLYYSYIKKIVKGVRVIIMGVVDRYRKKGLETLLWLETYKTGTAKGYSWAELSWVLEDNVMMNRVAEGIGAKVYKRYRMYEMEI